MDTPPEDLKYISHYLQRANELRTREPVVSYYCKQLLCCKTCHKQGLEEQGQQRIFGQQKKDCGDNDAITNDVVGYAHIENFALKVFLNADNEDRSGKASSFNWSLFIKFLYKKIHFLHFTYACRKTAKTFMAAATFLELLKTFGDIDVEIEEKIKYAKWKATDIMKAFRDGRVPTPGPPGGLPQHDELPPSIHQISPSAPPQQPHRQSYAQPMPPSPAQSASPQLLSKPFTPAPPIPIDHTVVSTAQKHAKWAISALNYDDIKTARENLLKALDLLKNF
ncbi:Vta1 like-domain-containing protein [Jimgerdemannia flammicorona]|uniref:Vta1 like-domain-containing protein n=2 Tax=Jimgerdemannia flammicorona TaxID=994334 RepID=A0A433D3C9_9FUNG|nr:Vta1 like-domain-containing protein [Jimgerdemannia flammicorona]RUS28492.1 Vta1 like-domain-containing protein [Jimgerdemannia flammicorona]